MEKFASILSILVRKQLFGEVVIVKYLTILAPFTARED
jgi:hypothetical protein